MGKQSKAIGDQLRKAAATIVKATVLEIDANLREATPVDTGHARANWVPSIGTPATEVVSGEAANASGVAALLGYKLENGPAWESNNVPYIQVLNDGSSTQAPALFIEAAVDKALVTMQAKYGDAAIDVEKFRDAIVARDEGPQIPRAIRLARKRAAH